MTDSTRITLLALAVVGGLTGCNRAALRAHIENEKGVAFDAIARHGDAEPHYLRSIGYDVRPEIPMTNLGRSKTLAGAYSEAHQHFQQALERAPELYDAHFNDGVALYEWGESVRDPRHCEVDRTIDLWQQAILRFESARELALSEDDAAAADANQSNLAGRVEELEAYRDDPPAECTPPPPDPSDGGGDEDDEDDEENNEPPPPPPPAGAEPPPEGEGEGEAEPPPMSEPELERIRQLLGELRGQTRAEGKYFRGSREEQYPRESWENPERVIKW